MLKESYFLSKAISQARDKSAEFDTSSIAVSDVPVRPLPKRTECQSETGVRWGFAGRNQMKLDGEILLGDVDG